MPTLLFEIEPRHFIDKQFFVVNFTTAAPAWGRKTFVEFGPLEGEIAEKKHKESGSPIAWTGLGTVNFNNITMKRGVGLDLPPQDGGVLDDDMLEWWNAAVNGVSTTGANFKHDCTVTPMSRDGQAYGYAFIVVGMVPVKYVPFEGDANSDDVQLEEMECAVSKWDKTTNNVPAFGTLS